MGTHRKYCWFAANHFDYAADRGEDDDHATQNAYNPNNCSGYVCRSALSTSDAATRETINYWNGRLDESGVG
jgi:hypothetical protein